MDQVKSKFEKFSDEELLRLIGNAQTQLNNAKLKQRVSSVCSGRLIKCCHNILLFLGH